MAEEASQPGELLEGLPFMSLQPGTISAFNNLPFGVVADIVVMVVGDITPTQTEEPLMGTGVENMPSTYDCASVTIVGLGQAVLRRYRHQLWTFWKSCLSKWSDNSS